MRIIFGLIIFALLFALFSIAMFALEANAVMGAPDQTAEERLLSTCGSDLECATMYDAIYGEGAAAKLEEELRKCASPSPLAPCPQDDKPCPEEVE